VQTIGYNSWDAQRTWTCVCDGEYDGPSCTRRRCPTGDDPHTHCLQSSFQGNTPETQSSGKIGQTQQVTYDIPYPVAGPLYHATGASAQPPYTPSAIDLNNYPGLASEVHALFDLHQTEAAAASPLSASASTQELAEEFVLRYRDSFNARFTTQTIKGPFTTTGSTLASNVEKALENLPNKKVKDVTVATTSTYARGAAGTCTACTTPSVTFTVEFMPDLLSSSNVGAQNLLECPAEYSCSQAGCRPKTTAPYAIRYVGMTEGGSGTPLVVATTAATADDIDYTNYNANAYTAWSEGRIAVLHSDSEPRYPTGGVANNIGLNAVPPEYRFDGRIELVVIDHPDGDTDSSALLYYRVGLFDGVQDTADNAGNDYDTAVYTFRPSERTNLKPKPEYDSATGVVSSAIPGDYTLYGRIPLSGYDRIAIPEVPGVWISLSSANPVATVATAEAGSADGNMVVSEIVWKLPRCSTSVYDSSNSLWQAVATYVENIECSGRGTCNEMTGECACYQGYYGLACSKRTTLV
jgi:hypothetical protein